MTEQPLDQTSIKEDKEVSDIIKLQDKLLHAYDVHGRKVMYRLVVMMYMKFLILIFLLVYLRKLFLGFYDHQVLLKHVDLTH